ncbi:MAG: 50S ribosomal protein L11 [Candidatus Woesearchaeota archaeon]|jgi:large subunit ribosomal protein L11
MAKEIIEVQIEGGKATAAPPLGPKLGPLKVNIAQIVADINKKTADFKGMQVPVKLTVDVDTKAYDIEIGTPPASQLIKSELKIESGSGKPNTEIKADITLEQVRKVARMKSSLLGKTEQSRVCEILGTCDAMGLTCEGTKPRDFIKIINSGELDSRFK